MGMRRTKEILPQSVNPQLLENVQDACRRRGVTVKVVRYGRYLIWEFSTPQMNTPVRVIHGRNLLHLPDGLTRAGGLWHGVAEAEGWGR